MSLINPALNSILTSESLVAKQEAAIGVPQTVVSVKGLHKSFAGKVALNNVDLEIKSGQVFAILGANTVVYIYGSAAFNKSIDSDTIFFKSCKLISK